MVHKQRCTDHIHPTCCECGDPPWKKVISKHVRSLANKESYVNLIKPRRFSDTSVEKHSCFQFLFNGSGSVTFKFGQVKFLFFDWQEIPANTKVIYLW